MSEISGGIVTNVESFRNWRRAHPVETLEALHSAGNPKIIAFKLFSNHLAREQIEAAFLPRSDMAFAVLRRRPIESYISSIKAKQIDTFGLANTTDIKPELSTDEFVVWARKIRDWFDWVRESLEARDLPFVKISYERHLNGLSGHETIAQLGDLLRPVGIEHVSASEKIKEGKRQDKEMDYRNRVANWDAFAQNLRASPQFEELLSWAESEA